MRNLKLTNATGFPHDTKLTAEDGAVNLALGAEEITVVIKRGQLVAALVELPLREVGLSLDSASFVAVNPLTGEQQEVKSITFLDGTVVDF